MKRLAPHLVAALALTLVPPSRAEFILPTLAPVDRLAENIGLYVEAHPTDAQGHYLPGRVHALAFIHQRDDVYVWREGPGTKDELPGVCDDDGQRGLVEPTPDEHPQRDEAQALDHLERALLAYRRALELAPEEAVFQLSFAHVLELADGRVLPTYDWVVRSKPAAP